MRDIKNDYELVIRVSKALERMLEEDFDVPGEKTLYQRIECIKERVPHNVIDDLKLLNHLRNRLVHDVHVNGLSDMDVTRHEFINRFERAQRALRQSFETSPWGGAEIMPTNPRVQPARMEEEDASNGMGWLGALAVGAAVVGGLAVASSSAEAEAQRRRDRRGNN